MATKILLAKRLDTTKTMTPDDFLDSNEETHDTWQTEKERRMKTKVLLGVTEDEDVKLWWLIFWIISLNFPKEASLFNLLGESEYQNDFENYYLHWSIQTIHFQLLSYTLIQYQFLKNYREMSTSTLFHSKFIATDFLKLSCLTKQTHKNWWIIHRSLEIITFLSSVLYSSFLFEPNIISSSGIMIIALRVEPIPTEHLAANTFWNRIEKPFYTHFPLLLSLMCFGVSLMPWSFWFHCRYLGFWIKAL